jgi:molybdopterin-containing oxidoreductase family iron-sulfur binding subunit
MSCEENHEARAEDRQIRKDDRKETREQDRKSLPILGQSVAAERRPWRSLAERARVGVAPGAANEFAPGADQLDGVSRRGFMQLLGVSTAVATVGAACRKPNEKIVPFVRRPEEVTPGNPLHFATAASLDGYASGLLVTSHEGRPTKIEGNPAHPQTIGATTPFDQALILGLYDDDRAKTLRRGNDPIAWPAFIAETAAYTARSAANGGAGIRFLTGPTSSPLLGDLRRRILERFPKAKFVSYSPVAADGAVEGTKLAFGKPLAPRHRLGGAALILSLDADFLGDGPEQTRLSREFAVRREPSARMVRLYSVGPDMTITGAMADHRLRLAGSDVGGFAAALCAMLAGRGLAALAPLSGLAHGQGQGKWDPKWLIAVAADLERNRGQSLVIAGRRQPAAVHALAAALNAALGNVGVTVDYAAPLTSDATAGAAPLAALAEEIAAGTVETLVITAQNPAYTAPVDLKLAKLLERIPNTIYHALYEDETAAACKTIIPAAHVLESWGDARATDGTVSIVQPLIAPLWGGIPEADVLAAFVGDGQVGAHELVRRYWRSQASTPAAPAAAGTPGGPPAAPAGAEKGAGSAAPAAAAPPTTAAALAAEAAFEGTWERWLADGIIPSTGTSVESGLSVDGNVLAQAVAPALSRNKAGIEIAFAVDPKVYDGRFANNAWLQELAHPITKLAWDNAVMLSENTAKALGLEDWDVVELTYRERAVEGAIMIVPGHADDAVTLPLGYGRSAGSENVARDVGFNANALRTSDAPWFDRGVTLTKTGRQVKFAVTQDTWTMAPDGRETIPPAVEAPIAEFLQPNSKLHQELEERRGPLPTIHQPVDYSTQTYKWGMAIDLNKCTGCNACVVACQSENNISVVGKENVAKGRAMQWIRIDRYFTGPVEDPEIIMQPVACVQCETAPCEYVCPVNATVHSDEGLNEMVYNRCIGTRYCSNNCPYKVRRFNFLDYVSDTTAARELGMNPDVTVRSRGVMEKCTYCVQRIERARIRTRIEGRTIADGEIETACQQGCPTRAITFGSLNDPNSKVTQLQAEPRRYDLLHEIGTRPRTVYLARARNPNPDLAKVE